jgi:hypothetical protein
MVAVVGPSLGQCCADNDGAVTAPAEVGVRDNILQEAVAPSLTEQIRCGDEHARSRDPCTFVGHENVEPLTLECLPPHGFRAIERLNGRAHLRRGEQFEE